MPLDDGQRRRQGHAQRVPARRRERVEPLDGDVRAVELVHGAAPGDRQQLGAEAEPQHGDAGRDRPAQQLELGREERVAIGAQGAHLPAEAHNAGDLVQRGEPRRGIARQQAHLQPCARHRVPDQPELGASACA